MIRRWRELRKFLDAVEELAEITVTSTPAQGAAELTATLGKVEDLHAVAELAERHKLVLSYDGTAIHVDAEPPPGLPDETTPEEKSK